MGATSPSLLKWKMLPTTTTTRVGECLLFNSQAAQHALFFSSKRYLFLVFFYNHHSCLSRLKAHFTANHHSCLSRLKESTFYCKDKMWFATWFLVLKVDEHKKGDRATASCPFVQRNHEPCPKMVYFAIGFYNKNSAII